MFPGFASVSLGHSRVRREGVAVYLLCDGEFKLDEVVKRLSRGSEPSSRNEASLREVLLRQTFVAEYLIDKFVRKGGNRHDCVGEMRRRWEEGRRDENCESERSGGKKGKKARERWKRRVRLCGGGEEVEVKAGRLRRKLVICCERAIARDRIDSKQFGQLNFLELEYEEAH